MLALRDGCIFPDADGIHRIACVTAGTTIGEMAGGGGGCSIRRSFPKQFLRMQMRNKEERTATRWKAAPLVTEALRETRSLRLLFGQIDVHRRRLLSNASPRVPKKKPSMLLLKLGAARGTGNAVRELTSAGAPGHDVHGRPVASDLRRGRTPPGMPRRCHSLFRWSPNGSARAEKNGYAADQSVQTAPAIAARQKTTLIKIMCALRRVGTRRAEVRQSCR
ncbi:hypothetical protein MRX96_004440 [Rhipicephalus microplus]